MLKGRRKRLRQVSKQHHFLLQCIDNSIHNGCKLPLHVPSHADKRKPGQEHTWTHQDWGNYIADRAADRDYHTLRMKGITVEVREYSAVEIYNSLLDNNQWYIGYTNSKPIRPNGIFNHVHTTRFQSYITDRAEYRDELHLDPYWHNNSLQYASKVLKLRASSIPHIASKCRVLFDKCWHGRNRQKEKGLSTEEAIDTGRCTLCKEQDSQAHMLQHCTDITTAAIRADTMVTLRQYIYK